jgi:NAD(P)-dependent dehydrogenase (short-subunit alcohol dehydrogenase family)
MPKLGFEGRVAILTGSGRGLGRHYALLLASRGASVVVNDAGVELDGHGHDDEPARSVVAEIEATGGTAIANFDDVREADTAELLVQTALQNFGRLDIVVNNAGIISSKRFEEQTEYDLTAAVEVHLYGTTRVARAAFPHLAKAKHGRIINTTSSVIFGVAENSVYATVKAGVFGLTRAIALEGAEHGIRANCIAPAGWTRMAIESAADEMLTPEMWEFAQAAMAPQANAAVVAYLAHESCNISGEVLSYSGGRLARWVLTETEGVQVDADLTPEEVADQLDTVFATDTLHTFKTADDLVQYTQQKLVARRQ